MSKSKSMLTVVLEARRGFLQLEVFLDDRTLVGFVGSLRESASLMLLRLSFGPSIMAYFSLGNVDFVLLLWNPTLYRLLV